MPGRWSEFRSQDSDTQQAWVQIPFHHWEGWLTLGTCANFPPGKTDDSLCMRLLPGRAGSPGWIKHFLSLHWQRHSEEGRAMTAFWLPSQHTHQPTHGLLPLLREEQESWLHTLLSTPLPHLSEGKPGIYRNNVGLHVGLNMGKTGEKLSRDMGLG